MKHDEDILAFVDGYVTEHRHCPSYDEIGAHISVGKPTVAYHMRRLEEQGLIRRAPFAKRAITITESGMAALVDRL